MKKTKKPKKSEFVREDRYLVLKRKDIENYLTQTERDILCDICLKIYSNRITNKKNLIRCVVIEHDWPEYEKVWKMLEKRVTNEKR